MAEKKLFFKLCNTDAGWSSLVARRAHNPKVAGSNPAPATNKIKGLRYQAAAPSYLLPTVFPTGKPNFAPD